MCKCYYIFKKINRKVSFKGIFKCCYWKNKNLYVNE